MLVLENCFRLDRNYNSSNVTPAIGTHLSIRVKGGTGVYSAIKLGDKDLYPNGFRALHAHGDKFITMTTFRFFFFVSEPGKVFPAVERFTGG